MISDSEMEDFEAAIIQAGFNVADFKRAQDQDPPTAKEQHPITGTVTIQRISTDGAITIRWVLIRSGRSNLRPICKQENSASHRFERLRCRLKNRHFGPFADLARSGQLQYPESRDCSTKWPSDPVRGNKWDNWRLS